jgi:hypothetical protein
MPNPTPKWLVAALAPAPDIAAGAAAGPHGGRPRASETTAIERAAARVKRLTQASSYRLTNCSTKRSGVTCRVRWGYGSFACSAKLRAHSANGAVKVKRASSTSCRNLGYPA